MRLCVRAASVRVCMCARVRACVRTCVRARARVCLCVCAYTCRGKERQGTQLTTPISDISAVEPMMKLYGKMGVTRDSVYPHAPLRKSINSITLTESPGL